MNKHTDQREKVSVGPVASVQELQDAADRLARFHRVSWREALGKVASAAFRLHHYRDISTRMFYDALCEVECDVTVCESNDD